MALIARAAGEARETVGRRVDPALLLRRIERPADAGHERRDAVPPARRLASGAHGVRRADRRRQRSALRQDAVDHLRGLSRGAPHHHVGREPVGVRHSPRPLHSRGAAQRRHADRHRSADDGARQAGRHSSGDQTRHRSAGRALDPSLSSSRKASPIARFSTRTPVTPSSCAPRRCRGRSNAPRPKPASPPPRSRRSPSVRGSQPGPDPVRMGPGAQSQRRQLQPGDPGAAGSRRQVWRPRRRLRDEQHRGVGHRAHLDWRAGARDSPDQHEPARTCAHRARSTGSRVVRLQLERGGHVTGSAADHSRARA